MSSRIAHHLDFADYDIDELISIGRLMAGEASYYLSEAAEAAFGRYLMGADGRAPVRQRAQRP